VARLFADENIPLEVVLELRRLGHDVTTVGEVGKANRRFPDAGVFLHAVNDCRTILTKNRRDFRRFHRRHPTHPGMVLCTEDFDFVGQAQRIHDAISDISDLTGLLIRVYRLSR
jgi:hypothetical protein